MDNKMEAINKLKEEAYRIAMETYSDRYGDHYRWNVDVRLDAMKTYAMLVRAEKETTQN